MILKPLFKKISVTLGLTLAFSALGFGSFLWYMSGGHLVPEFKIALTNNSPTNVVNLEMSGLQSIRSDMPYLLQPGETVELSCELDEVRMFVEKVEALAMEFPEKILPASFSSDGSSSIHFGFVFESDNLQEMPETNETTSDTISMLPFLASMDICMFGNNCDLSKVCSERCLSYIGLVFDDIE